MKLDKTRTSRSGIDDGAPQTSEEVAARLEDVERRMERLRAQYESFFAGIERRIPQSPRIELNRIMLQLQQANIRNAALRFRYQSASQRFTLLTTYWNRTLREIESGCYRRDLERAYRRLASRGAPLTETEAGQLGIPAHRVQAFVQQQNRRFQAISAEPERSARTQAAAPSGRPLGDPPASAIPRPPALPADGDVLALQRLHADYVAAHAQLGTTAAPPSATYLASVVAPKMARLRNGRPSAVVTFSVAIREGKIVVTASTNPDPSRTHDSGG